MPEALNNDKAKLILQRAVDAGFLDNNYKPIKGKMTRAQQKMFALYAGIELGLDKPWSAFGILFDYPNLQQVREWESSQKRLDEIRNLFPKDIVEKAKRK